MIDKDKFIWEIQIDSNGEPIIVAETALALSNDNGIMFEATKPNATPAETGGRLK